jgi:hypothetical protein
MQTNHPTVFTWKRLLLPATVGVLVGLLQKKFFPESNDPATRRLMDMAAVVFVCLLGGFSLLKWRDSDLDYYRSLAPRSEETEQRLQQRRRKIGLIGGAFIAVGSLYLVVLLIRLAQG